MSNPIGDPGHGHSPAAWTAVSSCSSPSRRHARFLLRSCPRSSGPRPVSSSSALIVGWVLARPATASEGPKYSLESALSMLADLTAGAVEDAEAALARRPLAVVERDALAPRPARDALAALAPADQRQDHRRGQAREPVARRSRRHPRPGAAGPALRAGRRVGDQRAHRGTPVQGQPRRSRSRPRRGVACPSCARTSSRPRTRCSRRAPRAPTSSCSSSPRSTSRVLARLHDLVARTRHDPARRDALRRRGRTPRPTSAPRSSASTRAICRRSNSTATSSVAWPTASRPAPSRSPSPLS